MKTVVLFILSLFFLISCHSPSETEFSETFDIPIVNQNESLLQSGHYKELIQLNKNYLQLARKKKYKEGEALCYIYLAHVDVQIGNYKDAGTFLDKAKVILENSDNALVKSLFFYEFGRLNLMLDLYSHTLDNNNKAIYYSERIKDENTKKVFLGRLYLSKGNILADFNKQDSAQVYFRKALKIKYSPLSEAGMCQYYLNYTKHHDSASVYIHRSLQIVQAAQGPTMDDAFVYMVAGRYYIEAKEFDEAKKSYNKALNIFGKQDLLTYHYIYIYRDLMKLAEKEGKPKEKEFYLKRWGDLKEKIDKQQPYFTNIINEKSISEIKQKENKEKRSIWLYTILVIIILLFVCYYAYRQVNFLKKKKEFLRENNEKLQLEIKDKRLDEVIALAKQNDSTFLARFREVYPDFTEKLLVINPNLENSELIFCAMLRLNFTSKEIANYMFIQHDSVQRKKNRIRKRLNISSDVDLYQFFGKL